MSDIEKVEYTNKEVSDLIDTILSDRIDPKSKANYKYADEINSASIKTRFISDETNADVKCAIDPSNLTENEINLIANTFMTSSNTRTLTLNDGNNIFLSEDDEDETTTEMSMSAFDT